MCDEFQAQVELEAAHEKALALLVLVGHSVLPKMRDICGDLNFEQQIDGRRPNGQSRRGWAKVS